MGSSQSNQNENQCSAEERLIDPTSGNDVEEGTLECDKRKSNPKSTHTTVGTTVSENAAVGKEKDHSSIGRLFRLGALL